MIVGSKINDFQKVFLKRIRKTPQDKHKVLQDATRRSQDGPRRPKTPPRRAQGATRRPRSTPRRPQEEAQDEPGAEKIGIEKRSPIEPLQTSILERLGVDFGRFLGGFRGLSRSIFLGF